MTRQTSLGLLMCKLYPCQVCNLSNGRYHASCPFNSEGCIVTLFALWPCGGRPPNPPPPLPWGKPYVVTLRLVAAGAHRTWFHLYRLVLEQPPDMHITAEAGQEEERVQRVALAVEQFLQTSTVGEYEQRLSMVWSFRFVPAPITSLFRVPFQEAPVPPVCPPLPPPWCPLYLHASCSIYPHAPVLMPQYLCPATPP